jgi:integrase
MPRNLIPGDKTLQAIKFGDPRKRISDGEGLYLLLFVKGGAHGWRLDYSHAGKRKTLSLGTYPDTSLALARQKADQARRLLAAGKDPSEQRQAVKAAAAELQAAEQRRQAGEPEPGTFEAVAREWLSTVHEGKVSAGHAARTRIRLEQDAFPSIGRRPLADITGAELLQCLRKIEARGAIETAHRVKDACGQVFRYGIATERCARNPAADLREALRPVQVSHHAAIVDPAQAAKLLRDVDAYMGHQVTRAALHLSAMLLLRPGELRHMEWAWIDFGAAMLTVPPELMKRRKEQKASGPPHLVPLARQAVAVLRELQPLTGGQGRRFVFPSLLSSERCMSENTVRGALRRMGYANDDMTAHGFRAMARTMLAERLDVQPEVIEAQLAHAVGDMLGRAYNRTQYLQQRVQMMATWADYLDRLRTGGQVVTLHRPAADGLPV